MEIVWLDTQDDCSDESYFELCREELTAFIKRYEKRYHTDVNGFLLIGERESAYGNWNGRNGAACYRLIHDWDELMDTAGSDIKVYIDDDKFVHIDYTDHDGGTYSTVKLIPGSAWEYVWNDVGCYACDLDYVEYFQKNDQLEPTKFWNAK